MVTRGKFGDVNVAMVTSIVAMVTSVVAKVTSVVAMVSSVVAIATLMAAPMTTASVRKVWLLLFCRRLQTEYLPDKIEETATIQSTSAFR